MNEDNPSGINPGVVGAPDAKQQVGMPNYCLLFMHRDGTPFNIGQKCGQCSTVTTSQTEVTVSKDPDFGCTCLNKDQINAMTQKGITVLWVDGYPSRGSSELPAPPAVQA